jgi:hypothetical protein
VINAVRHDSNNTNEGYIQQQSLTTTKIGGLDFCNSFNNAFFVHFIDVRYFLSSVAALGGCLLQLGAFSSNLERRTNSQLEVRPIAHAEDKPAEHPRYDIESAVVP